MKWYNLKSELENIRINVWEKEKIGKNISKLKSIKIFHKSKT